jgi:hypothetical protein
MRMLVNVSEVRRALISLAGAALLGKFDAAQKLYQAHFIVV